MNKEQYEEVDWSESEESVSDQSSDSDSDQSNDSDSQQSMDTASTDSASKQNNILNLLDKKIVLKFMKEGKTSRTYIIGLDRFFTKQDELDKFCKDLQKMLGTSFLKRTVENNQNHYGYAGNHIERIYDILIDKNIAARSDIKKQ